VRRGQEPAAAADNNGTTGNCGFMTWQQCEAAASGNGGRCFLNPRYLDSHPRDTWRDTWSVPWWAEPPT